MTRRATQAPTARCQPGFRPAPGDQEGRRAFERILPPGRGPRRGINGGLASPGEPVTVAGYRNPAEASDSANRVLRLLGPG